MNYYKMAQIIRTVFPDPPNMIASFLITNLQPQPSMKHLNSHSV